MRFLLILVLTTLIATQCRAQKFDGSYVSKTGEASYTLTLKQDAGGSVTGTFSDGTNKMEVTGQAKDGVVSGHARLAGTPVAFAIRIRHDGGNVVMELTEEENGKADPQSTEKMVLKPVAGSKGAESPGDLPDSQNRPAKPSSGNPLDKKAPPADPFAGNFKAKDLVVLLRAAADGYEGTLTKDGTAYPLKAKRSGPGIEGTFKVGDDSFEFLAKVEGATMQLKTGDTVYLLEREGGAAPAPKSNPLDKPAGPKNPLAGGKAGALPVTKTGPVQPEWKLLSHPSGVSIRYPREWNVREIPGGGYQLMPPGADANSTDIYMINGQQVPGITKADDPQLAQGLDALVAQTAPIMKRSRPGEAVKADREPGMLFVYEGANSATARIYVVVIKGYAIAVVGMGDKAKVEARDGVLRQVFASLGWKEGERDPALVGSWSRVGTTSLDARDNVGRLQASSVSDTQRSMVLRPDGTCTSKEVSRTIAIGQGVSVDSGDQVTSRNGRWFAGNGKLILMWEKEAEEYTYRFNGGARELVIGSGGKTGEIWAQR